VSSCGVQGKFLIMGSRLICTVSDERGFSANFPMDDFTRYCLLNGLDDIGLTLQHEAEIAAYEAKHPVSFSL